LIPDFTKRFSKQLRYNDSDCIVIDFKNVLPLPLIELWAGGSMIDLEYAKKKFTQIKKNPGLLAHLFYLINSSGGLLSLSKNDFTSHNSVSSVNKYLKKLSSRVKNNIFNTDMGKGGLVKASRPPLLQLMKPAKEDVYALWSWESRAFTRPFLKHEG
jgi:hypothetical protein